MTKEKILVINPGSTSTKIAVFQAEQEVWTENIRHEQEELRNYPTVYDQLDMRKDLIRACLEKHGEALDSFNAFVSRGGCMKPVQAGAYEVNDAMVDNLHYDAVDQHASNVGAGIALQFAREVGVKAYVYDALTIDEMLPVNTITGLKGMRREARGHNLNTRAAALFVCKEKGVDYNTQNIVVCHLGGGITTNLHSGGKMIDVIMDAEGTFSPERAGGLPTYSLVKLCYSGKYTQVEMMKQLQRRGGMMDYFGTTDMIEVEKLIKEGNEEAKLVYDAMVLSVAKNIAKITPVVNGKIDFIVLTGGLANWKGFVEDVKARISFLAPVEVVPGEHEMEALAGGTLRVLRGEEVAKTFEA